MARRAIPRKWTTVACYVALGAFATLASGIPVTGSGPFNLMPSAQLDVYNAPAPAPLAAVTIDTSRGMVRVRTGNPGAYVGLGRVPAVNSCVFEGPFTRVNLLNQLSDGTGPTSGTWTVRAPVDGTYPDRLLGSGTVNLVPPATFTPYGSFNAAGGFLDRSRLIAVDATANPSAVTIVAETASGVPAPVSYVIDPGDWGFCSRSVARFKLQGSGPVPFAVYDPTVGCQPITGTARSLAAGETDSISVDGSRALEITLVNNSPGDVTVTYAIAGGPPVNMVITPTTPPAPISGAFTQFEWTYQAAGCTVNLSIRGH